MSQEQINIILESQKEFRDTIKEVHKEIETMRNEMHTEHKQVIERMVKLETSMSFVTRVCWGGIGGVLLMLAREVIPRIF